MPQGNRQPLPREEGLKAVPVRNPKVMYVPAGEGGRIEMTVAVMGGSWLARFLGRGTPEERTRRMELDAMGAFVWERCDGRRTVAEVVKALAERERTSEERAEESLWKFLGMLSVRGLVALAPPGPGAEAGDVGSRGDARAPAPE